MYIHSHLSLVVYTWQTIIKEFWVNVCSSQIGSSSSSKVVLTMATISTGQRFNVNIVFGQCCTYSIKFWRLAPLCDKVHHMDSKLKIFWHNFHVIILRYMTMIYTIHERSIICASERKYFNLCFLWSVLMLMWLYRVYFRQQEHREFWVTC